jgi:hypothetical protein
MRVGVKRKCPGAPGRLLSHIIPGKVASPLDATPPAPLVRATPKSWLLTRPSFKSTPTLSKELPAAAFA